MDGVRLLLARHTPSSNVKHIQYVLGLIMKKYDEFDTDCTAILQLTFYRCHKMLDSAKCDAVMINSILPVVFNLYAKYIDDEWWTDSNKELAQLLNCKIADVNATESSILQILEFNLDPQPEQIVQYKFWHAMYSTRYAQDLDDKEWELHIMIMRKNPTVTVTVEQECTMNIDNSWELIDDKQSSSSASWQLQVNDLVDFLCVEEVDMK